MVFRVSPQPDFRVTLARVEQLRRAGQALEAEQACRDVLSRQPAAVPVLNALAMLLADRGEFSESQALLRNALAQAPDEAVLHNNLGNILYQADDNEGALAAYRKAVALRPSYIEAQFNLAVVSSVMGQVEDALAGFRKVVELSPGYWQAHVQIASLLHQKGEDDAALKALDAAGAAAGQSYDAQYYRGTILHALGRHQEAGQAFDKAIALNPNRYEAHFAVAGTLAAIGREDDAIRCYKRAIELQPDYLPAHQEYNTLAHAMGKDVRQLQSYSFARSQAGDRPELLLAEAELMLKLGDAATAEFLLRKAPATRADIANALGRALTLAGRFQEGAEMLQRAVAAEPMTLANYHELAVALLSAGEAAGARDALLKAFALDPTHQATLAYLTIAHRLLGEAEFGRLFDADLLVREYELPVPAGYADAASFNQALAEQLVALHTRKAAPIDQTLRGGTQTSQALFERDVKEIRLLRDAIQEAVRDYVTSLPADASHPFLARKADDFHFAGSWSCRLASGGYHTSHIHQEGWISSAYYAALPDSVGAGEEGALNFGGSKFGFAGDEPLRRVRPGVGKLVLFPSYYWHGTEPFRASDTRLAVAFDIQPGAPLRMLKR